MPKESGCKHPPKQESGESDLNSTVIIQVKLQIQYNTCKPSADVQFPFQNSLAQLSLQIRQMFSIFLMRVLHFTRANGISAVKTGTDGREFLQIHFLRYAGFWNSTDIQWLLKVMQSGNLT